jgi:hypothetical protein
MMNALQCDISRLEEENEVMVQQIGALPKDSQRPRTPRKKHGCYTGSACRCSARSLPKSWRRHGA